MPVLSNVTDGEHIHQRCMLITGREPLPQYSDGSVSVTVTDDGGRLSFPRQFWPLCAGHFKALVILSPGRNHIALTTQAGTAAAQTEAAANTSLTLTYVPLLQTPPLHLAILVAKDSALQIDCPPAKHGALSTAHSSLEAAIAKFRLAAYMWQALTAEDLRSKGLERRSFRLEEEWGSDTVSKDYLDASNEGATHAAMQSTAKVHLVRTEHTVAELRDAQRAQQNSSARDRDAMHSIFSRALKQHGGVFQSDAHPVVAGLILDSHYSSQQSMIVAHAALGAHNPTGLSLGVFGSHLCYSWPRFVEEIPDCLLDTRPPGDLVGDDNGECASMWEACAVGQGAFLHEVGHAFSAPHTTGIMARGYSQHWPKSFLSRTAYCVAKKTAAIIPVTQDTPNDCNWDIRDALRFASLPHFRLPGDPLADSKVASAAPQVELLDDEDFLRIGISSESGVARVWLDGKIEPVASVANPIKSLQYTADELETRFDRSKPLDLEVVSMNGKSRTLNVWKLFSDRSFVRVPGTNIKLLKKSVGSEHDNDAANTWSWAVMLKKKSRKEGLISASKIDLRVGCGLDGAVVHYYDGSKMNCGPRWDSQGHEMHLGGHQSRKMALSSKADIVKVKVAHSSSGWSLDGLRMILSNGKAMGAINKQHGGAVTVLEPEKDHRIIGFYGNSGAYGMAREFGIVTAPKDVELPDSVYDLPELQNTDGGLGGKKGNKRRASNDDNDEDEDEDAETSEDEDAGYDYGSDETQG